MVAHLPETPTARRLAPLVEALRSELADLPVARHRLGVPQTSRDAFDLLVKGALIDPDLATALKNMVGFRNIAVHDDQRLALDIVEAIVTTRAEDLIAFARPALRMG